MPQNKSSSQSKPSRNSAKSRGSKPAWQKKTVKERIQILFNQAEWTFQDNPERSKRYVEMALKLSMRYNVRLDPVLKRKFCRSCHTLLRTSNSRTRTSPTQNAVTVTCKECGHVNRFPYRKEKQKPGK
jgi:ribonuclease P protein subunit RPR2